MHDIQILPTTPESRDGAWAAMLVLAKLHGAVANSEYEPDAVEAIDPVEAARIMLEAAGENLSPRMEGFLATLGQYLCACIDGGVLDVDAFEPFAMMDEAEQRAERRRQAEDSSV